MVAVTMGKSLTFSLLLQAFFMDIVLIDAATGDAGVTDCGAKMMQLSVSATRNDSGHWLLASTASSSGHVSSRPRPRLALDARLDVADQCDDGWVTLTTSMAMHAAPEGYERMPFGPDVTSLYRLHTKALPWNEAAAMCRKEGAHLLVINSEAEALVVKEYFSRKPELVGAINKYWFAAGFRRFLGRNETVLGGSLESSGYNKWAPFDGQWKLTDVSDCGAIDRRLLYALEDCKNPRGFICELDI